MGIYKIDIKELLEKILIIVEEHVFDNGKQQPSFHIEEKEAIIQACILYTQKLFEEYSIVEIKNSFIEEQKDVINEKKTLLH
jgi:hypothetical protein